MWCDMDPIFPAVQSSGFHWTMVDDFKPYVWDYLCVYSHPGLGRIWHVQKEQHNAQNSEHHGTSLKYDIFCLSDDYILSIGWLLIYI